ncbi:MAG: tetratricopeptide repeat protein [Anaerolineae bacterium]
MAEQTGTATEPERQERDWPKNLLPFLLFLAALAALYLALPVLHTPALTDALRILLILIGGLLPAMIYSSFIQIRLPTLSTEYRQSLRRLGYPENARQYQDKFNEIYGQKLRSGRPPRPGDAQQKDEFDETYRQEAKLDRLPYANSPITVATILAFVGWLLVFFPPVGTPEGLVPNPTPLAYGFLGAYVFGLGSLVRQYVTDDLQPRYYASLTSRYLTVFVLSWLVTLVVQAESDGSSPPAGNYLLAAFVIGLFPSTGLRVAQRLGTAALGIVIKGFKEDQPLSQLDGLNAYHEDRLLLEGIENLQNLGCANIVDLMLKTRYPVEQIVDWIDQALLHLHARGRIEDFQKSGLRTATDFLDAYDVVGLSDDELAKRREDLARLLDSHHSNEISEAQLAHTLTLLDTTASALRLDPNLFHVRYWREHEYEALPEDVERRRTQADLRLMQSLPDEAIVAYNDLLRDFPNYHTALLYRGLAYFALGEYSQALDNYTTAIERGGPNWESARYAYVERGRALRELKEYAEAAQNYQDALKAYEAFPEAHLELAYVQMTYLGQYDEAIDHLQTVIGEGFKEAEALANLGLVRYMRWDQTGRQAETRAVELGQAKADLERALRLKPDLIDARLNLAKVLEDLGRETEAIRTLTEALQRPETVPDPESAYRARLHRGNLYLNQNDYQSAMDDYRAATQLAPDDAAAFFNLGVACQHLGQLDSALSVFRDAIRLNPRHAPAHQELGDVAFALDLLDDAETAYSTALQLTREAGDQSGQALAHLSLGRLYRRLDGRQSDARRELERAMELDEDLVYTRASYELGLLHLAAGGLEAAVALFETSAELFDVLGRVRASAEANLQLGRAYLAQQDQAAAAEALEKARQQLARVFVPQDAGDAQLQRDIEAEMARCGST